MAISDLDDTTAFGPETITIRRSPPTTAGVFVAGVYRYWVHNFIGSTFAGSSAVVTVLSNGTQLGRFEVLNATGTPSDDIWYVVDLTIAANGNVVLTVRQTVQQGDGTTVL